MEASWLVSYVVLWIVVVALGFLALSHSRLLGVLYQRIGPGIARATSDGPAVGARISEIYATTLLGLPWVRRFPAEADSLAIFVSPQCLACNELMPHVKDFLDRFGTQIDLLLLSVLGDPAMNRAYVDLAKLHGAPYLIADRFAASVQVAGTPYGFKLNKDGVVLAKGIVNHYEHLVSLWNMTGPEPKPLEVRGSTSQEETSR
jgi:methylamine dehydrogenase accessory protein MauD